MIFTDITLFPESLNPRHIDNTCLHTFQHVNFEFVQPISLQSQIQTSCALLHTNLWFLYGYTVLLLRKFCLKKKQKQRINGAIKCWQAEHTSHTQASPEKKEGLESRNWTIANPSVTCAALLFTQQMSNCYILALVDFFFHLV